LPKFAAYTFFGSVPWNLGLACIGVVLAERWKTIETYFREFDYLILFFIILCLIWLVRNHFLKRRGKK